MVFFCFSNKDDLLQIYSEALYPFSFLIIQDRRPENRVEDTGSISQQHDNEFPFKAVLVGHIW